jgi:serine/threonine-protein kinase
MAAIYLGRRVTGTGPQAVALKVIKEEYAKNPEFVDMFVDEARIVAKLDHPNIVKLYDAGREGDRLYFAMELLMGQSLWAVWQACRERGVRMRYDLASFIGARVAEGLHHAHELKDSQGVPQELVHRDVNQTNIFLTYEGQVKIIDFGLAKALGRISRTGAGIVKGKLAYMSPEQTIGRTIDRRTDVFALGTTLYEVTADRRLFRGKDDAETLKAVHEAQVPDPMTFIKTYPSWLWEVLHHALDRDPARRFQSAQDMARALDACSLRGGRRLSPASIAEVLAALFENERTRQMAWLAEASNAARGPELPTMQPPAGQVSYVGMGSPIQSTSDLFTPADTPAPSSALPIPPKPAVATEGASMDSDRTQASHSPSPSKAKGQRSGPHPVVLLLVLCVALAAAGAGLAILSR